jgi:NADH:ubiquinone oxidoreductase subunit E
MRFRGSASHLAYPIVEFYPQAFAMAEKQTLYICMGSACHQIGVYEVLPILQNLITSFHVDDQLELKGAFCLGVCAQGIVLKLGEKFITGVNHRNVQKKFEEEILSQLPRELRL